MSNRRPGASGRARYAADRRAAGVGLLVVVGVIGVILGAHGWSVRNSGAVGGNFSAVGGGSSSTSTTSPSSSGTPTSTTQPQSATSTSTPSGSSSTSSGPTLASAGYAPFAYEIYPGKETASTRLALAGFNYAIRPQASGIALKLTIAGSGQTAVQKSYPSSDKIYFIDTTLGDDSGNADYSYGDDGLIATNANGHIVQ